MIGQTISHYKILEKLGEGGMGVVYKAQDTKLDRTVALKFLPAHVSVNDEIKARFIQEAKAAASLNHNNICTIHGVEEHDQPDKAGLAGGQMFIVMEYIEGGTLRQKLPYAKVDDALNVALQIGEALQEAHAKGIVHRDIKSDNVMLTSKGQAKVMDFGLAKLKGSLKLTRTSSTVGTLAYMAPEQVQGGEVDSRSDIFSFGVLLFEMLTGRTPFRGEHEAAMVYSIVNEEPEPLQKHVPNASPELQYVIKSALEKNPEDRYQQISDVVRDLRRLRKQTSHVGRPTTGYQVPQQPSGETPAAHLPSQVSEVQVIPRRSYNKLYIGIAAVVVITASIVFWLFQRSSREPAGPMVMRVLKVPSSNVNFPNISADGNWVVFVAEDAKRMPNLYIVHASGGDPRKVTDDTIYVTKQVPCFSPDASQIVYERLEFGSTFHQDIYVVSALGGTSRKLISNATLPMWSPDGKRIAFFRGPAQPFGLWIANSDGTGETKLTSLASTAGRFFYNVAWSPDSKRLAFLRNFLSPTKDLYTEIFVRELKDSAEGQITFDKKTIDDFCWTTTGEIVFNSTRGGDVDLWVIPEGGGTPKQLTLGAGADRIPRISKDAKHLVYVNESETTNLWSLDLQTKQLQQLTFEDWQVLLPVHSWDGARLMYWQSDVFETSRNAFVVCNKDGTDPARAMPTIEDYTVTSISPGRWSVDGKAVFLGAVRRDTVRRNPDSVVVHSTFFEHELGTTVTRKIADGTLLDISRDGKYVLYRRDRDSIFWRGVLALKDAPDKAIQEIKSPWGPPHFSWDSKSIISQDSVGIWITPAEGGKTARLVKRPKNFGFALATPDGKSLLGTEWDPTARSNTVVKFLLSGGTVEKIVTLPPGTGIWGWSSTVSPDGKTLVFSKSEIKNKIVLLDNFR